MQKSNKALYIIGLLVSIILSVVIFINNEYKYLIIACPLVIILMLLSIKEFMDYSTPEKSYKSTLKRIIKTYDAVLVKATEIPDIKEKNVIKVADLLDFIDAQAEIRKPIVYVIGEQSTDFLIIDETEVCVYSLKLEENVKTELEKYLDNLEKVEAPKEALEDIENTTIIKLKNNKKVKVSPVREEESDDDLELPKMK